MHFFGGGPQPTPSHIRPFTARFSQKCTSLAGGCCKSRSQELDISRRGVQFLGPESLYSPSYEGVKVHVPQNTILNIIYIRLYTMHWHYVIAMASAIAGKESTRHRDGGVTTLPHGTNSRAVYPAAQATEERSSKAPGWRGTGGISPPKG